MDMTISCKDLGAECTFTACAATETQLFEMILEHGRVIHGMKEFPPDVYDKVRASIRKSYCDFEGTRCKIGECGY